MVYLSPRPPSLAISNAGGTNVTLAWPAPATGFNLYNTTNLAPATRLKITNAPANSNGALCALNHQPSTLNQFPPPTTPAFSG